MTTTLLDRRLELVPALPQATRRATAARAPEPPDGATRIEPSVRRLRLTRRGRIVVGGLFVVVALLVFSLGRVTAGADPGVASTRVTVQSGDSLWSIAQRVAPDADPRDLVARLEIANHLSPSAGLEPGQVLVVPTR